MNSAFDVCTPLEKRKLGGGSGMDGKSRFPISAACAALVAGIGVVIAGYSWNWAEYAWPIAALLFLVAYAFFARWVKETNRERNSLLQALEWLRRALAYDPQPRRVNGQQLP
jgi:hypothetical protein